MFGNREVQNGDDMVEVLRDDGTMPKLLYDLLTRATPYGCEHHIIKLFPFRAAGKCDKFGNFIYTIPNITEVDGKTHIKPLETMFSCHMDTVHTLSPKALEKKADCRIKLVTKNPKKCKPQEEGFVWGAIPHTPTEKQDWVWDGCPLGADDKAGVWIMCKLIEAQVPGLYVFHVGEEKGCIGSGQLVAQTPEVVKGIKRCIAFDRMDYTHVISTQRGQRCCSVEFSNGLADAINANLKVTAPTSQYKGEVIGVYTDSANYRNLIPECTNISVGYFNQHGADEKLDIIFLTEILMPALKKVEWEKLPTIRDHTYVAPAIVHRDYNYGYGNTYKEEDHWIPKKNVRMGTAYQQLPIHDYAKEGYCHEATLDGNIEMFNKWMNRVGTVHREAAKFVVDLMIKKDILALRLRALETPENTTEALNDSLDDIHDLNAGIKAPVQEPLPLLLPPTSSTTTITSAGTEEKITIVQDLLTSAKIDKEHFPKDEKEFALRMETKIALIGVYMAHKSTFKVSGSDAQLLIHSEQKYQKVLFNYTKGQLSRSKKAYRVLNSLLCDTISLLEKSDGKIPQTLLKALLEGQQYRDRYWYEPGIILRVA